MYALLVVIAVFCIYYFQYIFFVITFFLSLVVLLQPYLANMQVSLQRSVKARHMMPYFCRVFYLCLLNTICLIQLERIMHFYFTTRHLSTLRCSSILSVFAILYLFSSILESATGQFFLSIEKTRCLSDCIICC